LARLSGESSALKVKQETKETRETRRNKGSALDKGQYNERGIREVLNEYYDTPTEKQNRIKKQTHADGGTFVFDYTIAGSNITETTMTSSNKLPEVGALSRGFVMIQAHLEINT